MNAYSVDLRQRIVAVVQAGLPRQEVAGRFCVSLSTVNRLLRQWREQGHLAAKPRPGAARRIAPGQHQTLCAQLQGAPDATLQEHCQKWQQTSAVMVSVATMSRAIGRAGWTRKKRI